MRFQWTPAILVALVCLSTCRAEDEKNTAGKNRFPRENPVVLAVRKTQESIVTLRVTKKNARKDTVGTGVIIDSRGYIVTNRHVVQNATEIKIVLSDKTSLQAELDFSEPNHDLAVVKVSTKRPLKAMSFAPSSDLMLGETVIAIGHPFGFVNTVSTGIVSGLDREVEMPGNVILKGLIQITASINPGNSGGPLLNVNGELIGINVALHSEAQGIAFALNADSVQEVLTKRLAAGLKLGIEHGLQTNQKVEKDGEDRVRVVVKDVSTGTPAAAAGLKEGDEIVKLGEFRVGNRFDVERALWDARTGDVVEVVVVREGRKVTVPMKLETTRTASR